MGLPVTHATVILLSIETWLAVWVEGHIGEPCTSIATIRLCLPPSPHIYCDASNICRCKSDFPVEIQPHTCKTAKHVGQRCTHQRECTQNDPNSFCTKIPYGSECACSANFTFNYSEERCVPGTSTKGARPDSKWFLPSTIGFSLICLGIAFCFTFFWYFFCRRPPESWEEQIRRRETRAQVVRLNDRRSGDYLNVRSSSGHLPTYESAVYNQPPPSYEEAIQIKDFSDPVVAPSSTAASLPPLATPEVSTVTTAFITPPEPKNEP